MGKKNPGKGISVVCKYRALKKEIGKYLVNMKGSFAESRTKRTKDRGGRIHTENT